jgi:hypothetical protein
MNPRLKLILYNVAFGHFVLFAVNALCFGIALVFARTFMQWGYDDFAFSINDVVLGIPYNSTTAKVLVAVVFVTLTLKDYKRLMPPAAGSNP